MLPAKRHWSWAVRFVTNSYSEMVVKRYFKRVSLSGEGESWVIE